MTTLKELKNIKSYLKMTINEKINFKSAMKKNGFLFNNPMVTIFAVISVKNN